MYKKLLTIGISIALAFGTALALLSNSGAGASNPSHVHDHALFDTTSGDSSVQCGSGSKAFEFNMSMRAINNDTVARVTFQDGDFVNYPIPQDTSFSLSEAAGDTPGVDGKLVVTTSGGAGSLVGWMSANRANGSGAFVSCTTV